MPVTEVKLSAAWHVGHEQCPGLHQHTPRKAQHQLPSATLSDKSDVPVERTWDQGLQRRFGDRSEGT